ncbi:MAG: patatin [Hyphomicrobiales bacterium]|nr:patatin [Hyphomicrobiales bacterium]
MNSARPASSPTIALALGAGGARGLAHVAVLEALDDLGLPPVEIAGTSMGAILGAAYAAGLTGREIRAHLLGLLRDRAGVMSLLLRARIGRFKDLFSGGFSNPVLIDGEVFLDLFWPKAVPDRFEELKLPFTAVATDFAGRCETAFNSGPLAPAVAGSMAIPGLVKPVMANGRILVDGGAVNPLPFRGLLSRADLVIACDVTGGPVADRAGAPSPFEAMFGTAQIMQNAITSEMLKVSRPDILLVPAVQGFRVLDFFKAAQILAAAEPLRDEIKRAIDAHLENILKSPVEPS